MMILKALTGIKLLLTHPKICFKGSSGAELLPLENRLISELKNQLKPFESEILGSQIEEINLIERVHTSKTIVSFNVVHRLAYSLERKKKFIGDKDEFVLSKIDFQLSGKKYRVIFYVVYGNFFSMEFTANMSHLLGEENIQVL